MIKQLSRTGTDQVTECFWEILSQMKTRDFRSDIPCSDD